MVDRYTKVVLTIIALALSLLALQGLIPSVVAQSRLSCGSLISPCHVVLDLDQAYSDKIQVDVSGRLSVNNY